MIGCQLELASDRKDVKMQLEKINGEWIMKCCMETDPKRLKTQEDLILILRKIGFIPLFANSITGFSVEERTIETAWWTGDAKTDPWEWRILLSSNPEVAYGKFFDKKAGFIHRDFFPLFANYRRNGYDYDSLYDDGLASFRSKKIMDAFGLNDEAVGKEMMGNELKEIAGFGKDSEEKNFNGVLTDLQMQTYLIMSSFKQRKNKKGEDYGWHIAVMGTPETKWGYDYITSCYTEEPSVSWNRIVEQINRFFSNADESQIKKVFGIRYPGTESVAKKRGRKALEKPKKVKLIWPENILKEIGNVPMHLNEDQMLGLQYVISNLPDREKKIIRHKFEEGMTCRAISEFFGVTPNRISQIKRKALRRLRHPIRSNYIRNGYEGNTRIVQGKKSSGV